MYRLAFLFSSSLGESCDHVQKSLYDVILYWFFWSFTSCTPNPLTSQSMLPDPHPCRIPPKRKRPKTSFKTNKRKQNKNHLAPLSFLSLQHFLIYPSGIGWPHQQIFIAISNRHWSMSLASGTLDANRNSLLEILLLLPVMRILQLSFSSTSRLKYSRKL